MLCGLCLACGNGTRAKLFLGRAMDLAYGITNNESHKRYVVDGIADRVMVDFIMDGKSPLSDEFLYRMTDEYKGAVKEGLAPPIYI